jgi:protein involved in polysaccharide export with SLBB domain
VNTKKLLCELFVLLVSCLSVNAQIEAGKSINITIAGVPPKDQAMITNTYPVSESGMINMPLLGPMRAAGLRSEQLQSSLQAAYRTARYYRNPTIQVIVTANVANPNQESVTVGGQVRKSGPIPYAKELTLWSAIQAAGGATEFGSMKRVTLTRDGRSKQYDVTKPQFMQIPLQRNDTVDVPQKGILGN